MDRLVRIDQEQVKLIVINPFHRNGLIIGMLAA